MQEVKEELRAERNKRLALQVSEACFEFCMHLYLLPTAYYHTKTKNKNKKKLQKLWYN